MKGKQKVITFGRERGMVLVKRKVIKVGTSVAVVLPAEFVREQNIKPGDEVALAVGQWVQVIPLTQLDSNSLRLAYWSMGVSTW